MKRRSISLLAATLAATIILAFLAGCSPANIDAAATRAVAVKALSPHLPVGNPSEAGIEPNNRVLAVTRRRIWFLLTFTPLRQNTIVQQLNRNKLLLLGIYMNRGFRDAERMRI